MGRRAARQWDLADELRAKRKLPPLKRESLHEGRHSYSTWLDAAGITASRADRYLGHSRGSVQERYRHLLDGQLIEDAQRIDAYLTGAIEGKVVALPVAAAR